ncbi:MAG: hypothetical protein FWD22_06390 [Treponema sp.]|nr:hypothetical protein [Treponema sp.]
MKNKLLQIGIIALAIFIGFVIVACDDRCMHSWGEWFVDVSPTCWNNGIGTQYCMHCGEISPQTWIPRDFDIHTWGEWYGVTKEPNCNETGIGMRYCLDCYNTDPNTIIPIDQTVHIPQVGNDCTAATICQLCEHPFQTGELSHIWGEWYGVTEEPNCYETGIGSRDCTRDGCEHTEADEIPALGHDDGEWQITIEPGCTNNGEKELLCSRCNYLLDTGIAVTNGCDWGDWITTATFLFAGEETRTCKRDSAHTENRDADALTIITTNDWNAALSQLIGRTGSYTLTISGEIGVAGRTTNSFGTTASGSSLSVTLKGSGRLFLTSVGNLF